LGNTGLAEMHSERVPQVVNIHRPASVVFFRNTSKLEVTAENPTPTVWQ